MPTVTLIPSFNRLRYGDRLNIRSDAVSSQLQKCLTMTWLHLVSFALGMCLYWTRLESVHVLDKQRQVIYLALKLGWKGVRGWSLMNCKHGTCSG
ncbi:hypothetical protein K469DRAFT_710411 [Zopfia rhizophila CBS 207.26]|uniref:Uncharacterized protein n=1 Tax=Zopfia rhizophila CBS 207.26 TaxID=1314779 RepID=A0A6A6DVJ3_9PEZI|nr:hypothetical protein K469DRAFT_710411 [Zopfia rhizophila CBS 207.26]